MITRRTALGTLAAASLAPLGAGRLLAATTHEVEIRQFKFNPKEITVKVGDAINFTNRDTAPHTATARDNSWDSGTADGGGTRTVTFDTAGEFDYFCRFHPNMKGKVTVTA